MDEIENKIIFGINFKYGEINLDNAVTMDSKDLICKDREGLFQVFKEAYTVLAYNMARSYENILNNKNDK